MGEYGPNDIIYRSDGNIYFTDPSRGFYRVSPAGDLTGPMNDVQSPNGVVLSPDENTLYVGDVNNQTVSSFPLIADGSLDTASGGVFANTQSGTVDGMAVDCAGNVYAGTSNGVEVFSPVGVALGVVPTGESSNVTFGGTDRMTLYVTSRSLLKAVTLTIPGLPD
jgi:gluconolactonase